MPADFLESQIGLYERQSSELEGWMRSHAETMQCRDVEDLIGFGLFTLEGIKRHNRLWSDEVRSGGTEFTWDDGERFARVYKAWLQATHLILVATARCEERGYELEGANKLRSEVEDVSLMSLDTQRLKSSVESLQQGKGIPHEKAMNELRDRLRRARI